MFCMSEWVVSLGGLRSVRRAFPEHRSELVDHLVQGPSPAQEGPGWVLAKSTRCGALASKVAAHFGAS